MTDVVDTLPWVPLTAEERAAFERLRGGRRVVRGGARLEPEPQRGSDGAWRLVRQELVYSVVFDDGVRVTLRQEVEDGEV